MAMKTAPVTVGLLPHQVRALDRMARRGNTDRSALVRKALAAWGPLRDELDLDDANGGG